MVEFYKTNFIRFLLVQLTFVLFVQAFPERLSLRVRDGNEVIRLNWKKTDRDVANSNLPIWSARRLQDPVLIPDLMNEIGPFAMYQDVRKSSAIVLFQHQQRIFGIIDSRYWISALPLSLVNTNEIHDVGTFILKRSPQNQFQDEQTDFPPVNLADMSYLNSFVDEWVASASNGSVACPSDLDTANIFSSTRVPSGSVNQPHTLTGVPDPQAETSRQNNANFIDDQTDEILRPELLVMVSNNMIKHVTKNDPTSLRPVVAYYLIYFNAVDMLYAKLEPEVKIRINIAGLVLESEIFVFPYAFGPSNGQPLRVIDGAETLRRFPRYLKQYEDIFPRDSFDFFFFATRYMIQDDNTDRSTFHSSDMSSQSGSASDESMKDFVPCDGISRLANVYENRKINAQEHDVSGLIVGYKSIYGDYATAAHEIAHLMHVDHDPSSEGNTCDGGQCFAILQDTGTYCRFCIRWSDKSISELRRYISTNREHCFLLNSPRSLHPHGSIVPSMGPDEQCKCYQYTSHWQVASFANAVNPHGCNVMLLCAHNNRLVTEQLPKPIDGTPCGHGRVCWEGKCEYSYNPFMTSHA